MPKHPTAGSPSPSSPASGGAQHDEPASLAKRIEEADQLADVLGDKSGQQKLKRWLGTLGRLVLGRQAFEDPEALGLHFVKDLVPLIQHFPRQLFELLALTLKATLDTRLRPLLAASVGKADADEQAEVNAWEECAQRIVGGASNWLIANADSVKELNIFGAELLPTFCEVLSDEDFLTLFALQRNILEVVCAALAESGANRKVVSKATGGRPALLGSERLGDLLYRLKHKSPPFLDTLDIAVHLLPRRGSPERVAFTETLFSEFRPEIAIKAATKMEQGRGAAWDAVTRPEILKILARESLDAVQPVPLLELSETLHDGTIHHRFCSDEDQRAIRKGRKLILFDDLMIVIEGDEDGDGRNHNIIYSVIDELEVDEGRDGKDATTTLRLHTEQCFTSLKLSVPYYELYNVLLQRLLPCAIPPPIGRPASSYRSSVGKEHVQLPDLGQQALDQAKADEANRARQEKSQGRSRAAEARAAELSLAARSESSELAVGRSEPSAAAAGAAGRGGKSNGALSSKSSAAAPRPPPKKSSIAKASPAASVGSTSQRKTSSAGRPRVRSTEQPSHVQVSISDLGSDLSEPSDVESPSAAPSGRVRSDSSKRKRPVAATASEDEAVDTTIIVESSASPPPPPQPPRKKARAADDVSDTESDVDEPETWVPPKSKPKGRGYTKKAQPASNVAGRPASKPSKRATKTSSTARSSDATAADDTWDELPGAREVAKPVKSRPKPKARLNNVAAPKSSTSQASTTKKKSAPATGKGKEAAPTRITPARRAAARANKHLADEAESEDIEDESQRMDVDSPHSSTIEEFSTQEKAEPPRAKQRAVAERRATTASHQASAEAALAPALTASNAPAARATPLTAASGRAKAPVRVAPESAADARSDEGHRARSSGSSRHPTPVSQTDSRGGGMDYEPQLESPVGNEQGSADVGDGVLSLSLGEPVVPKPSPAANHSPVPTNIASSPKGRTSQRTSLARSRSRTPALQIHRDEPRLASASQVFARPGALRQASILGDVDDNITSQRAGPEKAVPEVESQKGAMSAKRAEAPWKVLASKAADEQQAHARALEQEVRNRLAADNIELTDVFDEDPNAHVDNAPFDALRDAHSTPRALKHGLAATERSLSEPAADHGLVAVDEPQPASDGILSVKSTERHVHVSPELQRGKPRASTTEAPSLSDQEALATLQRAPVRAPLAAKNVRVLSLAEVIPSQADDQAASTLASTSAGSGRLQHSLDLTVRDGDVSRLRAAADERASRGPSAASTSGGREDCGPVEQQQPAPQGRQPPEAVPPPRTKIALSPRSAGMSAKDKRHPSQPQRASSARAGDPPAARSLKKLLDQLNDELVDKCVRRITSTKRRTHEAVTKYQKSLTALHRRFADETLAILSRSDDVDARTARELDEIARDLADLRVASKACATELAGLRDRYAASYAAQETALATLSAGLKQSRA